MAASALATHLVTIVRATGHIEIARVHLAAGRFAQAADETNLALRELRAASTGQARVAPALQHLWGKFFLRTGQRERGRQMLRDVAASFARCQAPTTGVGRSSRSNRWRVRRGAAGDDEFAQWAAMQMIEHDPNYAADTTPWLCRRGNAGTAPRRNVSSRRRCSYGAAPIPSLAEISEIRARCWARCVADLARQRRARFECN